MNTSRSTTERSVGQELLRAVAVSLLGLPAAATDPLRALAWLALVAPAAGALAARAGVASLRLVCAMPGLWLILLVSVDARSTANLPHPAWAALVVFGLVLIGWSCGRCRSGPVWRAGGVALAATAVLVALPGLAGWARAPWPPALAARLLDASPVVLAEECAGVDWMRHAAVYAAAGTHSIGPELRSPYRGQLAGPATLVVGCALAWLARRVRARQPPDREERPWHCASSSAPFPKS